MDSERLHRSFFQNPLTGMLLLAPDFRIMKVNPAFCRMLGRNEEEWFDQLSFSKVLFVEDRQACLEQLRRLARREHEYFFIESRYIAKSGGVIEARSYFEGFFEADGQYLGSAVTVLSLEAQKKAEEALRLAEFSVEHSGLSTIWFNRDAKVVHANDATVRALGYSRDELLKMHVSDFDPVFQSRQTWDDTWEMIKARQEYLMLETKHRRRDGTVFPVEVLSSYAVYGGQEYVFSFIRDITERKKAEIEQERLQTQILQAQKMEAVGRLAGGVAHDFNNMLSVIIGFSDLIREGLNPGDPLRKEVDEVLRAAYKSADLTRQLLAFSRRQTVAPQALDLNQLIKASQKMLQRLLGEDISLRFKAEKSLWPVWMDPSQIDQILVNLSVNARDAMENGGILSIETECVTFDAHYCQHHIGAQPGEYCCIVFCDNGIGMDRETLEHVFEPFFTSKPDGKGTGLGLSTVFGIVKQNGGFLNVYSEPGLGTTFRIYLPRFQGELSHLPEKTAIGHWNGTETVLVVEDEPQILALCKAYLKNHGYHVLTASHPGEAILMCEKAIEQIDLLITDVVMPGLNGKELKERIERLKPGIKTLYMSGYTADIIAHRGVLSDEDCFIPKPFTTRDFLGKVRCALDKAQ